MASFKKAKRYEFCDALPKSNNGKILKAELRQALSKADGRLT
jgi:acyl-coenzyme A synthetase/AMP-(fatty) acid ligase